MTSISFECRGTAEARLIRTAAALHGHALRQRGIDPRDYAQPTAAGAGFGWDAVMRAAWDMDRGTVTHMSSRMAGALREALASLAERTPDRDQHLDARWTADRLAALIGAAERHAHGGA